MGNSLRLDFGYLLLETPSAVPSADELVRPMELVHFVFGLLVQGLDAEHVR